MEIIVYLRENFMEVFTLVTGIVYVVLEIRQKNFMWILGMLTSAATVYVFFVQGLYASAILNVYYFIIAFWGLFQWKKDSAAVQDSGSIHLNRLPLGTIWVSLALFIAGTANLTFIMERFGDPMSVLDASVTMLSAIATWWLGKSYLQQWFLWIAANALTFVMCLHQSLYLLSVLYAVYVFSAVFGYFHWKRHGMYI